MTCYALSLALARVADSWALGYSLMTKESHLWCFWHNSWNCFHRWMYWCLSCSHWHWLLSWMVSPWVTWWPSVPRCRPPLPLTALSPAIWCWQVRKGRRSSWGIRLSWWDARSQARSVACNIASRCSVKYSLLDTDPKARVSCPGLPTNWQPVSTFRT